MPRPRLHRRNYVLPVSYTDSVNQEPFSPIFEAAASDQKLQDTEARFQLSFKNRLWTTDDRDWGLWMAFTQQSQWQVYNSESETSRPFRETNYQPNGRSQVLSRSWDRLFVEAGFERENLALLVRGWYRMHESADEDDNPDITR